MRVDAVAANGKHIFPVCLLAGAHTQAAENAAVQIQHHVGVGGIHFAVRVELFKVRAFHAHGIGSGLQAAVAAFFARGAEMVALHKQHLQHGLALAVELGRVALHILAAGRLHRAARAASPVDFDGANAATSRRAEFGVPTQVGDVVPGPRGRLQNGFPVAEFDLFSIEHKGAGDERIDAVTHVRVSRWAPLSSRPVARRAWDSSASKSKPGTKCSDFRCCS